MKLQSLLLALCLLVTAECQPTEEKVDTSKLKGTVLFLTPIFKLNRRHDIVDRSTYQFYERLEGGTSFTKNSVLCSYHNRYGDLKFHCEWDAQEGQIDKRAKEEGIDIPLNLEGITDQYVNCIGYYLDHRDKDHIQCNGRVDLTDKDKKELVRAIRREALEEFKKTQE